MKILNHRGIVFCDPVIGAAARLQVARAHVQAGAAAKARNAYQDFFTHWKQADPDIPILKEARVEYARL